MSFIKEFGFTLSPAIFELIIRIVFLPGHGWSSYFSAGTLMVTFAVWSMVTALKFPTRPLIKTDNEVTEGLKETRVLLLFLSMYGLLFFGSNVTAIALAERFDSQMNSRDIIQDAFASIALLYAIFSVILIWRNRKIIDGFFNV